MDRLDQSKALASDARQAILQWLQDPRRHFAHQRTEPPEQVGVCVTLIAEKLGVSQPTASRHLDVLRRAGFLRVCKRGGWSFFKRNDKAIKDYARWLERSL